MEILEAYDLAGTLRGAAALAGCDHKTVARLVAARDAAGGGAPVRARCRPLVDPFSEKIDELVDRSRAQIRADKAHGILVAMGYEGSYRTTRRAGEVLERGAEQHGSKHQEGDPVERRARLLGEGGDLDGFTAQQVADSLQATKAAMKPEPPSPTAMP
jgi:hypothetical protein